MWTEAHRARHEAGLKSVVTMFAVGQVATWLEQANPPHSARAVPMLAVVGAIAWHLRVGGPWRAPPAAYPHWRTVYGWFRRWSEEGLFEALMRHVARLRRRARGRQHDQRQAGVDTQAVKAIPVQGPHGFDAAKRVVGGKRVALIDADGVWLALAVVPAGMQDRDCLEALSGGKAAWPSLRVALLDGAFTGERCRDWCHLHGLRHRVVERAPGQRGFVVVEKRWVVERTFGALVHWGGLLRSRVGRLDAAATRLACVIVLSGVEAPTNPKPIRKAAAGLYSNRL